MRQSEKCSISDVKIGQADNRSPPSILYLHTVHANTSIYIKYDITPHISNIKPAKTDIFWRQQKHNTSILSPFDVANV